MAVLTRMAPLAWRRFQKATLKDGSCRGWWTSHCRRYSVEEHRHGRRGRVYFVARVWVASQGEVEGGWQQIALTYGRGIAVAHCEEHRRRVVNGGGHD